MATNSTTAIEENKMKKSKAGNSKLPENRPPIRVEKSEKDGINHVLVHIDEDYLDTAFGTDNPVVMKQRFAEVSLIVNKDSSTLNEEITIGAVELMKELAPRDSIEALLCSQMVAIHTALVDVSWRLRKSGTMEQFGIYEKASNRLARTFATQMEALNKHRRKGTQKVVVQHVNVENGGQAVVGDITTGGGQ